MDEATLEYLQILRANEMKAMGKVEKYIDDLGVKRTKAVVEHKMHKSNVLSINHVLKLVGLA